MSRALGRDMASRGPRYSTLGQAANNIKHIGLAAPYMGRHIAEAAPLIANAPPEALAGLLTAGGATIKPPAAQTAPTRINEFKAAATLTSTSACGTCKLHDGTIVVIHYGYSPPRVMLCLKYDFDLSQFNAACTNIGPRIQVKGSRLLPHTIIPFNQNAAEQFTLCCNAASVTTIEITSFAATKPLNGLITAAHVMDVDDIPDPSTGSYELYSTTRKDSITSQPLQDGVVLAMGPESWPNSLHAPEHGRCPINNAYNICILGKTKTVTNKTGTDKDAIYYQNYYWEFDDILPTHKFIPGLELEVTITLDYKESLKKPLQQPTSFLGFVWLVSGKCPESSDACTSGGFTATNWVQQFHTAEIGKGMDPMCDYVMSGRVAVREDSVPVAVSAMLRTVDSEIAEYFEPEKSRVQIRLCATTQQHAFGPAHVARIHGVTPDISVQLENRTIIAGVQTSSSKAVAQPSPPNLVGIGPEDQVLLESLYDSPTTGIRRTMTKSQYVTAIDTAANVTRSGAIETLDAAPIGDTIRNIAGTIANIGHTLGGPFKTLGDIVNTVGGVAGGIGDTISGIFSAPKRLRLAAPHRAAPFDAKDALREVESETDYMITGPREQEGENSADFIKEVKKISSWSDRLNSVLLPGTEIPRARPGFASFPWVEAGGKAGVATIFISDKPININSKASSYYSITLKGQTVNYGIDRHLVDKNEPGYIREACRTLVTLGYRKAFVTVSVKEDVFGDSFSAALIAAALSPTEDVLVTGAAAVAEGNTLVIRPVGEVAAKVAHAVEIGLPIIVPNEAETIEIRNSVEGTPAITLGDLVLGLSTQTPQMITVSTAPELLLALTFLRASKSRPIGQTEKLEYEVSKQTALDKNRQILSERDIYKKEGKEAADWEKLTQTTFEVAAPTGGTVPIKLLDISFWDSNQDPLYTPNTASEKGMGLSHTKMLNLIEQGAVDRLRGIAMGLLAKIHSRSRPAKKKGLNPSTRGAPYKRPQPTQLASLIARLRRPRESGDQTPMQED